MNAYNLINSTKNHSHSTKQVSVLIFFISIFISGIKNPEHADVKNIYEPSDYFFISRSYPDHVFPINAYKNGLKQAEQDYVNNLSAARSGGADWIVEGPTNIGGRINCVVVHPENPNIILVGNASGGIFKTTDGGDNWYPVFDNFSYLSIAHIVYDLSDPDILFAGTGDVNISGYPFIGDGLYKSEDGGETWNYVALSETAIISKIIIHPMNHDIIYVATMGLPFERNEDRGLYKSEDGGITFGKVLFLSDETGVIDIVTDPNDPEKIYAAGWDRIRNNHESLVYGEGAKIYRSSNGGDTWTTLSSGLPTGPQSRISLEIDPIDESILYASYIGVDLQLEGIYKTTNGGNTWNDLPIGDVSDALGGFGWYFDAIQINTHAPNNLFLLGVDIYRTTNDGDDWENVDDPSMHADKHAMHFVGDGTYYLATDGGLYKTSTDAEHWNDAENIANSQFYHVDLNPFDPDHYWGGLQDNGTTLGNVSMVDEWPRIWGGDGFHTEFRTDIENVYYVETQNGYITGYDGSDYFDATDGLDYSDRFNWNTPYIISKHNNDILYCGSHRIYKSDAGVVPYFFPLSEDLTDGNIFGTRFHTTTVIEESDFDANVIYVGTTDANVSRTTDGGSTWENITGSLPERFVTDIEVSHLSPNKVYVSHSGYKENDFIPHIHYSLDKGDSWIDISGDLPQLAVNAIEIYPDNDDYIFAATDGGVYYTTNGGIHWERLGTNMPVIAVYDLEIDAENHKLIAGTFARSCWSISLDGLFPIVLTTSENQNICAGESVILSASGAEVYTWSPDGFTCLDAVCSEISVTPDETTIYTVIGSDGLGNNDTAEITIIVNPKPEIEIEESIGILSATEIAGATYQWYLEEIILSGETTNSYTLPFDAGGTYSVIVTNQYDCSDTAFYYVETDIEQNQLYYPQIFPNPTTEFLQIDFDPSLQGQILPFKIYDGKGNILIAGDIFIQSQIKIEIEKFSSGIYFIEFKINGKTSIQKFYNYSY